MSEGTLPQLRAIRADLLIVTRSVNEQGVCPTCAFVTSSVLHYPGCALDEAFRKTEALIADLEAHEKNKVALDLYFMDKTKSERNIL